MRLKGKARTELSALERGKREYARGDLSAAIGHYNDAWVQEPHNPEVAYRSGLALIGMRQYKGAAQFLEHAIRFDPSSAAAAYNLGVAYEASGQDYKASSSYHNALRLAPENAIPHVNLGGIAYRAGLTDIGYQEHSKALAIETDDPDQLGQRSFVTLLRGDYPKGFQEYECRWQSIQVKATNWQPVVSQRWHGQRFTEPTQVLIFAEQGLGDTLMMLRYHGHLLGRNAIPVYAIDPVLWPLLPPDSLTTLPKTEPIGIEYHCPMMSLPLACGTTIETIPHKDGYLMPPDTLDTSALERSSRPLVGYVTSGNPGHMNDHDRSIPKHLRDFVERPFAHGIDWVCLDKSDCFFDLRHLGDTADILGQLDAVVCIDSAIFHLGAALGKRTYLMPPSSPEWRHGLSTPGGTSPIPWYGPHVTAFWRLNTRDWPNTLTRVCEAVREELS